MKKNKKDKKVVEDIPEVESAKIPAIEKAMPETAAAAEQQPTTNHNSQNEDMEVHHHAHNPAEPHHKKNWKSYFWEFLMLFLAVFCGFLAEYQLEHKIERDKEKVYVQNLLEDLKADTAIYNEYTRNNKGLFNSIDTLILLIKSPERKQHIAKLALRQG